MLKNSPRKLLQCAVIACGLVGQARTAHAFWVVNFGPAAPLNPGHLAFVGGIGGQVVLAGDPARTSAVFFIPHAGVRVGLLPFLDVGLRLAPLPLPYASVGPGLGGNLDVKVLLTPRTWRWHLALDVGAGVAHALVNDQGRFAWSPNAALLLSTGLGDSTQLTFMARYAYIGIPSAMGGPGRELRPRRGRVGRAAVPPQRPHRADARARGVPLPRRHRGSGAERLRRSVRGRARRDAVTGVVATGATPDAAAMTPTAQRSSLGPPAV